MRRFLAIVASVFVMGFVAQPASAQMAGLATAPAVAADASAQVHQVKSKKARRIAGAIALGVLGAVAAHQGYRYERHRRRCARWLHRCESYGNRRACYRYDTRC
ncbi:MAG: hypothetical protein AAFR55_03485 [Pseudomonadota bacterium]